MTKRTNGEHATTDRFAERAHESVDRIAATAGKGEEKIRREAAETEVRLKEAGLRAKQSSEEILQSISEFVHEKPLMALGLAFATGALLSTLRRRS